MILVCRYRPRGVRHEDETWDEWIKDVSPSPELLHAFRGKDQAAIGVPMFRRRYRTEMQAELRPPAGARAGRTGGRGETITLQPVVVHRRAPLSSHEVLRELLLEQTGG